MSIKRPTHTWLKTVLDAVDGIGTRSLGVATSLHAFYGGSGFARIATGGAGNLTSATFIGASGWGSTNVSASGGMVSATNITQFLVRYADNGGSGTPYTLSDIVTQLKNMNLLPR